jgi:hypothetical protein
LQINNATPLLYAGFAGAAYTADYAYTEFAAATGHWPLLTGTYSLEPLGTPCPAWATLTADFTRFMLRDASGEYALREVLRFTTADVGSSLTNARDNSFGRLTATVSFNPFGVTTASGKAVTVWHIWNGENWYNLEPAWNYEWYNNHPPAESTLGGAVVVQIGTPTDVELPSPDGLTTVIINPTL